MIAMSLTGVAGTQTVMIRESPTLPSLGLTSIQPVGGGHHIDSFFDVFTELSLDGGTSWIPNSAPSSYGPDGSSHVDLVPEPASFLMTAMALIGVAGIGRRRK
jgi:hypothetical protein